MPFHEILIRDCSAERKDMEECASNLYHDFGQLVTPILGGAAAVVDIVARFHKPKIRLIGTSDKMLKNVLFYNRRQLNADDKRLLVKLTNALARGMNLKLVAFSPSENPPLDFDSIFCKISSF